MKYVALVCIKQNDKFLTVSRGNKLDSLVFPGGGVEKNETFENAAKRELLEETGLVAETLTYIYSYIDSEIEIQVFRCTKYSGKLLSSSIEGFTFWVNKDKLLIGEFGSFYKDFFNSYKE